MDDVAAGRCSVLARLASKTVHLQRRLLCNAFLGGVHSRHTLQVQFQAHGMPKSPERLCPNVCLSWARALARRMLKEKRANDEEQRVERLLWLHGHVMARASQACQASKRGRAEAEENHAGGLQSQICKPQRIPRVCRRAYRSGMQVQVDGPAVKHSPLRLCRTSVHKQRL